MTKTKHLLEQSSLAADSANADGTWKIRVINEGRGSSGVYTRELLEAYHGAFDDVLSYNNHPVGDDGISSRNFLDIVGRVEGSTWVEEAEDGTLGVYANWRPDDDFKRKLEQYRDKLGLSIFIEGDGREDANGDFLVESFNSEDAFRSLDVVIAAGRGGRFEESLKKIYSPRIRVAESSQPGAASAQDPNTKDQHMTPEQFAELQASIKAALVEAVKTIAEAKADEQKQDQTLEEALAAYAETVKLIDAADLTDIQKESLKARASKGEDITQALESEKALKAEIAKSLQAEAQTTTTQYGTGRTLGESAASYSGPTAWGHK